jgi:putative nucleotidyltransferase with HDIG domain
MMVERLRELNHMIKENTIKTVSAMAHALAARDAYTEGHAARVGELAGRMARHMGLDGETEESVRLGGILHDIGKIGFSDLLFQAHEGRNPPDMVKEIVRHPGLGADILKDLDFLGTSREYVYFHHERLDIPLGARIVAVADSYDAITTDRTYQKGSSPEVAIGILREHAGIRWDEACISALQAVLEETGVIPCRCE